MASRKASILKPCGTGDESKLLELLKLGKEGVNVDEIDAQGAGGLHRAARQGHVRIVQIIMEHRANIDARDRKMITPLHEACAGGHSACVKVLLDFNAHPNLHKTNSSVTNGGFSPLHFAAANGHVQCVEYLLAASADVRGGDRAGECPLHVAVRNGSLDMVRRLLNEGLEPWIASHNGRTPLHVAALHGRAACAALLLDAAAKLPPTEKNSSGVGATATACKSAGNGSEVMLVERGDCGGASALHEGAAGGHVAVLELLLTRRADVDCEDTHGRTPLLCAAAEAQATAARFLLERGAAKQAGHPEVVAALEGRTDPEPHSFLHQAILKVSPAGRKILEDLERKQVEESASEGTAETAGDGKTGKQRRKERRRLAREAQS